MHQHTSGARYSFKVQLDNHAVDEQQKYILQPTRMDYQLILRSLGATSHASQVVKQLINIVGETIYFIADKRYNTEYIRICAKNKNMIPIILLISNKEFDKQVYKLRHLIENTFARLKYFRTIATQFDKLTRNYKSMIRIACIFIWCKAK